MYACPTGIELMSKWYAQVRAGMQREWTDLALADYANHRHACPACRGPLADPNYCHALVTDPQGQQEGEG